MSVLLMLLKDKQAASPKHNNAFWEGGSSSKRKNGTCVISGLPNQEPIEIVAMDRIEIPAKTKIQAQHKKEQILKDTVLWDIHHWKCLNLTFGRSTHA